MPRLDEQKKLHVFFQLSDIMTRKFFLQQIIAVRNQKEEKPKVVLLGRSLWTRRFMIKPETEEQSLVSVTVTNLGIVPITFDPSSQATARFRKSRFLPSWQT